jgi:hypothetical protein
MLKEMGGMDSISPPPLEISSPYPDENRWYSDRNPVFEWIPSSNKIVGYSCCLDHSPDTIPDSIIDTISNSISYENVGDGTWYFHIRAKDSDGDWSETSHCRINIDATPPLVEITRPKKGCLYFYNLEISTPFGSRPATRGWLTIKVNATDETSGMDKVEFYIDENILYVAHSPPYEWMWLPVPLLYTIKVIAYDEAGNAASDSIGVISFPF